MESVAVMATLTKIKRQKFSRVENLLLIRLDFTEAKIPDSKPVNPWLGHEKTELWLHLGKWFWRIP